MVFRLGLNSFFVKKSMSGQILREVLVFHNFLWPIKDSPARPRLRNQSTLTPLRVTPLRPLRDPFETGKALL